MKANYHCEICDKQGTMHPVECHEVWVYNENTAIQKLKKFRAICPLCHEVIHYGRATCIGNEGRAFDRFMKINKLNKDNAKGIISAVWRQWQFRNFIKWKLDVKDLDKYQIKIPREGTFGH